MSFDLDSIGYNYLIQILNERYYQTTDIKELKKINQLFKALGYRTESWLL